VLAYTTKQKLKKDHLQKFFFFFHKKCNLSRRINAQRPGTPRFRQDKHDAIKSKAEAMIWCSDNS